ncbi:MAG: hypothetical protein ACE5KH_04790 [Candidatus Geothermarchaeales archaeon]
MRYLVLRGSSREILLALPWDDLEEKREVYGRELLNEIDARSRGDDAEPVSLSVEVGEILHRVKDIPENEINLCQIRTRGEEDVTSLQIPPSDILTELGKGSVVHCYIGGLWRRIVT